METFERRRDLLAWPLGPGRAEGQTIQIQLSMQLKAGAAHFLISVVG
jgi:hypothetical protein